MSTDINKPNYPCLSVETALDNYLKEISAENLQFETIDIENALSRIPYEDIPVKNDYPAFDKALVDGYAVRSADLTYATKSKPIKLKIVGESTVENRKKPGISQKETVRISKGAALPENADAVILSEFITLENDYIKVFGSTLPDSFVIRRGEDLKAGDIFVRKNRKIRPQDIGGIIGAGYRQINVFKKPAVTIIPTGSELVPIDIEPDEYQVISSNGYMLKSFVEQLGGLGKISSIAGDDINQIKNAVSKALEISEMVLISGGSSIGTDDFTLQAIESFENSKIIAHNISMKPGGHVLLAIINNKPVIGLPGHPVSNLTCFHVFVKPVLRKLTGAPGSFWQEKKDTIRFDAFLAKKICSPEGKEDYVRVRLTQEPDGKILAYPYTGKSSFLSTLVRSHGFIRIPAECAGLYEGDRVEVILF